MAKIKPFKGIRPPKELVEQVESRPYDVLDSEEARAEAGDNEKSLYHIIKPEIDFAPGTAENDPKVYDRAVVNFKKFQETYTAAFENATATNNKKVNEAIGFVYFFFSLPVTARHFWCKSVEHAYSGMIGSPISECSASLSSNLKSMNCGFSAVQGVHAPP